MRAGCPLCLSAPRTRTPPRLKGEPFQQPADETLVQATRQCGGVHLLCVSFTLVLREHSIGREAVFCTLLPLLLLISNLILFLLLFNVVQKTLRNCFVNFLFILHVIEDT